MDKGEEILKCLLTENKVHAIKVTIEESGKVKIFKPGFAYTQFMCKLIEDGINFKIEKYYGKVAETLYGDKINKRTR